MNKQSVSMKQLSTGQKPVSKTVALSGFLDKLKPQMALALPKHLTPDRMMRLVLSEFSKNPALQDCTQQSIAASIMTAGQMGLEPGIGGQGYLVPYGKVCQFVPGWKGLVDLVSRSGRGTVWTGAVFQGDEFDYALGDSPFVRHRPADDTPDDARMTHFYAVGRVKDAQLPIIEVWSTRKVEKHLNQFNKIGGRHYALKDDNNFQMYGRKVVLLQVLKYMPQSIELANAIAISERTDSGDLSHAVVIDGEFGTVVEQQEAPTTSEVVQSVAPTTETRDNSSNKKEQVNRDPRDDLIDDEPPF